MVTSPSMIFAFPFEMISWNVYTKPEIVISNLSKEPSVPTAILEL